MSDFVARLEQFLRSRNEPTAFEQLTPDASTREYFRIGWSGGSAIACVYPESFDVAEQNYIDVTDLFLRDDLPVAKILDFDEQLGVIVVEDLGDRILRDALAAASHQEKERLIDQAISLIPRIQLATETAFKVDSIAFRLKFDVEKLLWELVFFKTHYFTTFLKQPLDAATDKALTDEFRELCVELESNAAVLCHRDFHAANLMIDPNGELRIIDHQDARIGSVTYDLVSLLLDRVTEPPDAEWLGEKRRFFLAERERVGLPQIDESVFTNEFRLQTVQRCLKAVGTFSFQSANRGKTYFIPFIKPMFQIVLQAIEDLGRFPTLQQVLEAELGREQDNRVL